MNNDVETIAGQIRVEHLMDAYNAYINTLSRPVTYTLPERVEAVSVERVQELAIKYLRGKVTDLEQELDYLRLEKDAQRILLSAEAYLRASVFKTKATGAAWTEAIDILIKAQRQVIDDTKFGSMCYIGINKKYKHLWHKEPSQDMTAIAD